MRICRDSGRNMQIDIRGIKTYFGGVYCKHRRYSKRGCGNCEMQINVNSNKKKGKNIK